MMKLEERVLALERSCRRWRMGALVLLFACVTVVLVAAVREQEIPRLLRAHQIEVVDKDGDAGVVLQASPHFGGLMLVRAKGNLDDDATITRIRAVQGEAAARQPAQKTVVVSSDGVRLEASAGQRRITAFLKPDELTIDDLHATLRGRADRLEMAHVTSEGAGRAVKRGVFWLRASADRTAMVLVRGGEPNGVLLGCDARGGWGEFRKATGKGALLIGLDDSGAVPSLSLRNPGGDVLWHAGLDATSGARLELKDGKGRSRTFTATDGR